MSDTDAREQSRVLLEEFLYFAERTEDAHLVSPDTTPEGDEYPYPLELADQDSLISRFIDHYMAHVLRIPPR